MTLNATTKKALKKALKNNDEATIFAKTYAILNGCTTKQIKKRMLFMVNQIRKRNLEYIEEGDLMCVVFGEYMVYNQGETIEVTFGMKLV